MGLVGAGRGGRCSGGRRAVMVPASAPVAPSAAMFCNPAHCPFVPTASRLPESSLCLHCFIPPASHRPHLPTFLPTSPAAKVVLTVKSAHNMVDKAWLGKSDPYW